MDPKRARKRLEEERARLERVREGLLADPETGGDASGIGELSAYDQHPADIGTEVFEHEKNQALLEQVEAELREIEDAFKRVDAGTYGLSTLSGKPISDDRLEAMPYARFTVEEQAQAEREAGLTGSV
jgi:RNA polymerase-binding transcription factor